MWNPWNLLDSVTGDPDCFGFQGPSYPLASHSPPPLWHLDLPRDNKNRRLKSCWSKNMILVWACAPSVGTSDSAGKKTERERARHMIDEWRLHYSFIGLHYQGGNDATKKSIKKCNPHLSALFRTFGDARVLHQFTEDAGDVAFLSTLVQAFLRKPNKCGKWKHVLY